MSRFDAIVVAGGSGERLGGVDKASLTLGAQTLLSRALAAVAGARRTIVVGPPRTLPAHVLAVSEQPPGGGPAAAVAAGLAEVTSSWVAVLACDMPFVTDAHVQRLAETVMESGAVGVDGAIYVDGQGRRQPLAAIYRAQGLHGSVLALGEVGGASMQNLVKGLTLLELAADSVMSLDCDTWDDVIRSRQLLEEA